MRGRGCTFFSAVDHMTCVPHPKTGVDIDNMHVNTDNMHATPRTISLAEHATNYIIHFYTFLGIVPRSGKVAHLGQTIIYVRTADHLVPHLRLSKKVVQDLHRAGATQGNMR